MYDVYLAMKFIINNKLFLFIYSFIRSFFIYLFFYNSKRETKKYKCPVESCSKEVFNLPRHLRSKSHTWSKKSAKFALNQFNVRKKYQFATISQIASPKKVTKDYHIKRICPVESCTAVVMRIDEHLKRHHKMSRDERYYKMLKKATVYMPSKVVWNLESLQRSSEPLVQMWLLPWL